MLKNSRYWVSASLPTRVISTLAIFCLAFVFRWAINDYVELHYPVQLFLLVAMLVTLRYGYALGMMVLLPGWFLGLIFFVPPFGEFTSVTKSDVIRTVNYFTIGLVGIAVLEYLQRTRYSRRLMLAVSESRYRSLLRLDNHRVFQQRQAVRALRQVTEIFAHLDQVLLLVNQAKNVYALPLLMQLTGGPGEECSLDWLELVHIDDRPRVERELAYVLDGLKEHREFSLRMANRDRGHVEVVCVFRSLALSAHQKVFALLLKQPAA